MTADAVATRSRLVRELAGLGAAVAIAVIVVAVVAFTPRAELLFRDGDSLVTTLILRSIAAGQPQDWAMSSVLFVPETVGLWVITLLGLGVNGTLALAAVLSVVALYAVLRVAAGSARRERAPVAGALLGLAAFAVFAVSEASPSRDALEPASLLLTTTYYGATVLAALLTVGLLRRAFETGRRGPVWFLAAVAAASVFSNPLFIAWVTVPVAAVAALVAALVGRGAGDEGSGGVARWSVLALVGGSVAGLVARMPLDRLIVNTGAGYAQPDRWLDALAYYAGLAGERGETPAGAVALVVGVALWGWCIAASVLLLRRRRIGAAVVAACGWVMPLVVVIGAVALGTHAARYLQPIVFAPLLGLVVLPGVLARDGERAAAVVRGFAAGRLGLVAGAGAVVAVAVAGVLGVPRIVAAASAPDPDLACIVDWVEASGRTGAGQFWTVRLPKAHLADPGSLAQVDHELRGYAWLVNRADFTPGEVSFLLLDDASAPYSLPSGRSLDEAELVSCGRYTIADFGERALPLGPQRS